MAQGAIGGIPICAIIAGWKIGATLQMIRQATIGRGNNVMSLPTKPPLVVSLEGALTTSNLAVEALLIRIRRFPLFLLGAIYLLVTDARALRRNIAATGGIPVSTLPYNAELLGYLRAEHKSGRRLILLTHSGALVAQQISEHLRIFESVLDVSNESDTPGLAANKILEKTGGVFSYAEGKFLHLNIWSAARSAVLINPGPRVAEQIGRVADIEIEFVTQRSTVASWMRLLRVHQWVKNTLLFVPLMMSFADITAGIVAVMALAFLSWSLAASATYVANDLWDLTSDRAHPRKRHRPLACSTISIGRAILVAALLMAAALALAFEISVLYGLSLLTYVALTFAYSWKLKTYVLIDVLMLAILYTWRIIAGAISVSLHVSFWLLAFSVFFFLGLALVKRCAELLLLQREGRAPVSGRDYIVEDLKVLWSIGAGSSLISILVFGLYINQPETQQRFGTPEILWLVALALIYWIGRVWIKTSRGEMHDDPVVYALKDRASRLIVFLSLCAFIAAHLFHLKSLLVF